MARDNFKRDTKRKLAERAGYICSFPNCNKITIGPSKILKKSTLTGKASHIEAASPNGPRYNKNQKREERISIENGIWLCSLHADIIDNDNTRYSVNDLKRWKQEHEEKILYKQSGVSPESGNIVKIFIFNYGPIKNKLSINLHKNNIIYGDNGIGKTFICENLSNLFFKDKIIDRWQYNDRTSSSLFTITFLKENKREIKIEITKENIINYYYNNIIFSNIISPYNVVYVEEDFKINYFELDSVLKDITDYEYEITRNRYYLNSLLKQLNINENVFISLINYINFNEKYFIFGIEFKNNILSVQVKENSYLLNFTQLSGSEKQRVILELSIQLAKLYSETASTLFIIEQTAIFMFDDNFVISLLKLIIDSNFSFQTIITFADLYLLKKYPHAYDDYHMIHLLRDDENIKLEGE